MDRIFTRRDALCHWGVPRARWKGFGRFCSSHSGENREQRFEVGFVAGRLALYVLKKGLCCEKRRADDTDPGACRISQHARSVGRSFCVGQPVSAELVLARVPKAGRYKECCEPVLG